jgi:hypothetical protein
MSGNRKPNIEVIADETPASNDTDEQPSSGSDLEPKQLLLVAADDGAIMAGQWGPHRHCSTAVSGPTSSPELPHRPRGQGVIRCQNR